MKPAVFFDRDGTINELVYNPKTREYESPHRIQDLELMPNVIEALRQIQKAGFLLFLVSNQPSFAKGKVTLEDLQAIHQRLHDHLSEAGISFSEYYYCYHHPEGIVKGYNCKCACRKPKPFFLLEAKKEYSLDMRNSWMIGDQDFDIVCGQAAKVKTILLANEYSAHKRGAARPDFFAETLQEAVKIILDHCIKERI